MISRVLTYIDTYVSSKCKSPPIWQFEFDLKSYWIDFERSSLRIPIIVALVVTLFHRYIAETLLANAINFLGNNISTGPLANLIFYYLVLLYLVMTFVSRLTKGYFPSLHSLITALIYTSLYLLVLRNSESFTPLPVDYSLKYIDILFLGSLLLCSKFSLYFTRRETNRITYQFVTDRKNQEDLFGYNGLANELNEFIHNTETEHSFAIGILGNWGDGKTFLSDAIRSHFEAYSDDYLLIDFNPWLYNKERLVGGFFNELLSSTSFIDRSFKNDILSYAEKVSEKSDGDYIQLAKIALRMLQDHRSTEEIKKSISNKIRLSRKRIIIFLDDTDRLNRDEVQEVLKIVRNCADFANTFFITGIDYGYISTKVDTPKYLEKIFNLYVALPKVSESTLKMEIKRKFDKNFPADEVKQSIEELLKYEWFMSLIKNIRQLNRLINSLKLPYNKLKNNVDYTDLIILEVLKGSETVVYWELANEKLFKFSEIANLRERDRFDQWFGENFTKEKQVHTKKDVIEAALKYLIGRIGNRQLRAFSKGYELLYFNYANEGVDIVDFYRTIEGDIPQAIKTFNYWIAEDSQHENELPILLTEHLRKDFRKNYQRYLNILLMLDNTTFAIRVFTDVYLSELPDRPEELREHITGILESLRNFGNEVSLLRLEYTAIIVLERLRLRKDDENNASLPPEERKLVEDIYLDSLPAIIRLKEVTLEEKFLTFRRGVIGIKAGVYDYDQAYIEIFRNYILESETHLIDLLKIFVVRAWQIPYDDNNREVAISNYLSIIFEDRELVREKLATLQETEVGGLARFLMLNLDAYYNFRPNRMDFARVVRDENVHQALLKYFQGK